MKKYISTKYIIKPMNKEKSNKTSWRKDNKKQFGKKENLENEKNMKKA